MGQVGHFTGQPYDVDVFDIQRHGGKLPMTLPFYFVQVCGGW
jgi:hypothetical protein